MYMVTTELATEPLMILKQHVESFRTLGYGKMKLKEDYK